MVQKDHRKAQELARVPFEPRTRFNFLFKFGFLAKRPKSAKFSVNEKVDFLFKKDWIEGRIIKAASGQYLVRFSLGVCINNVKKTNGLFKKKTKKKWVASMAKKVCKLYTKRSKPKAIKSKGVKKKVISKNFAN